MINKEANKLLKKYFGYDSFRKGQEEIIDTILRGKDACAVGTVNIKGSHLFGLRLISFTSRVTSK